MTLGIREKHSTGKMMDFTVMFAVTTALVLMFSPSAYFQSPPSPISSPTPAPAPAPTYVNLTQLLNVAGPYRRFLNLLQTTKVIDIFQNQANNSEIGITIFAPKDGSFTALKNPSIKNLTQQQLKSLCLFHALPRYYSLAEFNNLSQTGPVNTLAGDKYSLNFTDVSGTVHLNSGWTNTLVSSAVYSTNPVAVYQIDKVLLPEEIFGTDIPPTPAPVLAPEIAPAADTVGMGNGSSPTTTSTPSTSNRIVSLGGWSQIVLALSGGTVFFL